MPTEEQYRKIIKQLEEKVTSLTVEVQRLRQQAGIHTDTPIFTGAMK